MNQTHACDWPIVSPPRWLHTFLQHSLMSIHIESSSGKSSLMYFLKKLTSKTLMNYWGHHPKSIRLRYWSCDDHRVLLRCINEWHMPWNHIPKSLPPTISLWFWVSSIINRQAYLHDSPMSRRYDFVLKLKCQYCTSIAIFPSLVRGQHR